MTELIKLPCGDWINPAHIQIARQVQVARMDAADTTQVSVWLADGSDSMEYYGADAIALAAALDAMSIKEGM